MRLLCADYVNAGTPSCSFVRRGNLSVQVLEETLVGTRGLELSATIEVDFV